MDDLLTSVAKHIVEKLEETLYLIQPSSELQLLFRISRFIDVFKKCNL